MAAPNRPPNPTSHQTNPNPSNPFSPTSAQRSTPTIFAARPLNPPSKNPNPNHTIPHGILYSSRPHPTSVQPSAAALPTVAAGVNPTVYARPNAPASAHVTSHVSQHQQQPHRFVYAGSDVPHHVRPAVLPSFAVPRTAGPSAAAPLKGVPIASHAKAQTMPAVAPTLEYAMARERERNRDDTFITINDRKVRLTDGEPCSIYSLCRSWVRNGAPHEIHSNYGHNENILPRPLPASFADSDEVEDDEKDQEEHEEDGAALKPFTTQSLLEEHIKRAKRVRARLTKKRRAKIKRFRQRLALILPPRMPTILSLEN